MIVAIVRFRGYQGAMSEQRILELEQQLLTANEAVAKLTLANAELTKKLTEAESHRLKMKRSAKRDESSLRQQLSVAQSRRF
jgi:F0F1-type ATP synthase membrane subunit b/b'